MPDCHVCSSRVSIYAKFCPECGAAQNKLDDAPETAEGNVFVPGARKKELVKVTQAQQVPVAEAKIVASSGKKKGTPASDYELDLKGMFNELVSVREARVGLLLIVVSLLLFLMLGNLPVAKMTSSEEGYMAYYDQFLERTPGGDTEAPREMIEDEALEDIFQGRVTLIQTTIGLLLFLGILVTAIGYLGWGESNAVLLGIRNMALYRSIQVVCFVMLSAALSFAGLTFDMFTNNIVLLPIVSLYMLVAFVIVLRTSRTLMEDVPELDDERLETAHNHLSDIFDFTAMAIVTISAFPWIVGLVDEAPTYMITEPALAAAEISDFQIYEMKLMLEDIQMVQNLLWLIVGACFVGFVSLRICDSSEKREFVSSAMLLASNAVVFLNLFLLFSVYSFVTTAGDYELYFNEMAASEEEQAQFYYFCNYFPVISGIAIVFYSIKYNMLTFRRALNGLVPEKLH